MLAFLQRVGLLRVVNGIINLAAVLAALAGFVAGLAARKQQGLAIVPA